MSRVYSVPPASDARAARASFTRASEILSKTPTPVPPRTFPVIAIDIRRLSEELSLLLELGGSLQSIDELAVALGRKCLAIQQETLHARGSRRSR